MLQTDQIVSSNRVAPYNLPVLVFLIAGSVLGVLYFLFSAGWTILELPRVLIGLLALWGPATALLYLMLRSSVADRLSRFTFSAIASYALTTLAYFGASVLGLTILFYTAGIVITLGIIIYQLKIRAWQQLAAVLKVNSIDWVLVALIAASLAVNTRYQSAYSVSPDTGDRTFLLNGDQTYYTSLVYELARHSPPLQQSILAGVPERAYHLFPHITTVLVAQFTDQSDALRAHLIYEYPVIEILLCLAIYCIGKILTKSCCGGYLGVSLLYLFAFPFPPLLDKFGPDFFFSLYPYVTSGLDPVAVTTPQMYSGLLVLYGLMLGVLLISVRAYTKQRVFALLIVVGLLVGAMLRFRIQIFIPLILGFLLLACYGLWRTRQIAYLIAAGVAVLVSGLLYMEMQSTVYLANSTRILIGNNGLTSAPLEAWINYWPFSDTVHNWLNRLFQESVSSAWAWQIVSMTCFVLFNMLGIPLVIALAVYLRSGSPFREWKLFTGLTIWLLLASTAGGMLISTNYDNYSVGGQMLLDTCWFVLPVLPVGLWRLFQFLKAHVSWSRQVWSTGIAAVVLVAIVLQQISTPSLLQLLSRSQNPVTISTNEWNALSYIHDSTPQAAVIISNKHLEPDKAVFSGIAGRASYYEYTETSLANLTSPSGSQEDRAKSIETLWSTTDPVQFCQVLKATVATNLVEYSGSPLHVQNILCMQQLWASTGAGEKVTIWAIER